MRQSWVLALLLVLLALPAVARAELISDGTTFRVELPAPAAASLNARLACLDRRPDGRTARRSAGLVLAAGERGATMTLAPASGDVPVACRLWGGEVPASTVAFGATGFAGEAAALRAVGLYAFLSARSGSLQALADHLRAALPGQPVRLVATLREARTPGTLYVLGRASRPGSLALALPLGRAALLLRGTPGGLPEVKVTRRVADRIEIGTALTIIGGADDPDGTVVQGGDGS